MRIHRVIWLVSSNVLFGPSLSQHSRSWLVVGRKVFFSLPFLFSFFFSFRCFFSSESPTGRRRTGADPLGFVLSLSIFVCFFFLLASSIPLRLRFIAEIGLLPLFYYFFFHPPFLLFLKVRRSRLFRSQFAIFVYFLGTGRSFFFIIPYGPLSFIIWITVMVAIICLLIVISSLPGRPLLCRNQWIDQGNPAKLGKKTQ